MAAGSTGRRNTGIKSLCWGFKLQGLTWSFVELTSHFVQIGLRMHRQVGAMRVNQVRASLDARSLLFFFTGDGRAAVFYRGNRILIFRNASWHLQPTEIEQGIHTLAVAYGIDPAVLVRV